MKNIIRFNSNIMKDWMTFLLVIAAVLFLPSFAPADVADGSGSPISNVAYDQQNPHTIYLIDQGVADADGYKFGLWLSIWEDWRNKATTGADIRGQFINADGTFCGKEFIISNSKGNQTVPRAAYRQDMDPAKSKVVVVWQDSRPNFVYFTELSNIDAGDGSATPTGCSFTLYSSEIIGVGDGGSTVFSGMLTQLPVAPGRVTVTAGPVVLKDDGAGAITGASAQGTVNYATGAVSLTFDTAPAPGINVNVGYKYMSGTGTEDAIGYNPVRFYSHDTASTESVGGEELGVGDGANRNFFGILFYKPILTGSVVVTDGFQECRDDALGGFEGNCTAGSINYATGEINIDFTDAPQNRRPVYVQYQYEVEVSGQEIGRGSISDSTSAFSNTLNSPLKPSSITVYYDETNICQDNGSGNFLISAVCGGGSVNYTSGSVGIIFVNPPVWQTAVNADYTFLPSIRGERIGTGDGASDTFSGVLAHAPIVPGSVAAFAGSEVLVDSGSGGLIGGAGSSGYIDYYTGTISANFASAPASGEPVTISFRYSNINADVSAEHVGYGSGSDTDFRATLAVAPVVPQSLYLTSNGILELSDDGSGRLLPTAIVTAESIGTGNGSTKVFTNTLVNKPVKNGRVVFKVDGIPKCSDSGLMIDCTVQVNYATGAIKTLFTEAPSSGAVLTADYWYYSGNASATDEPITAGDGTNKTFTHILSHYPVEKGTVSIKAGPSVVCNDTGLKTGCAVVVDYATGFVTATFTAAPATGVSITATYKYYSGTVNYNSGVVSASFAAAPSSGSIIEGNYEYRSYPPAKVSSNETLKARMTPKIAYDQSSDRFWVVWKETRSMLHRLSEVCFDYSNPAIADWTFDDSDFIGYVRLEGDTLYEQNSMLDVAGADIIRNADTTTLREVSRSLLALEETYEYESFSLAANPDVACDDTSTQCLIVSEGMRAKQTLTCTCDDVNSNNYCDLGEGVTSALSSAAFDDGFVHIYGLSDNYIPSAVVSSLKLDAAKGTTAHYPAVGFDPITKKFLAAWEDLRGGQKTKIYGQLILSGGGEYNDDFIISYQDTDKDGTNDPYVLDSIQSKPFISYDAVNQRFFVTWQDSRNTVLSMENLDIYGQKIDAEGSLRGNNFAILTEPSNQYNPTIAYNDMTATFLATWKDARNSDNNTCSINGGAGTGTGLTARPCNADVYGILFNLGQPSVTLLNPDNTALAPPLLNCFENPASSPVCSLPIVKVGLAATQSFKIRNTGDTVLKIDYIDQDLDCNGATGTRTIAPFTFDGVPAQLLTEGGSTIDLTPGAELPLTVRFEPLAGGSFNRCFIIKSDGGYRTVNLTALAVEPDIAVTPTGGDFGNVYIGNSLDKIFVVRNNGLADLKVASLDAPTAPFSIQSSDCITIVPGATCNIAVRFNPTVADTVADTLYEAHFNINSNDPDTPKLEVAVSGTAKGSPAITLNQTSLDFGNVQVNQTGLKTLTIRNDGTSPLHFTPVPAFSTLSAPFSYDINECLLLAGGLDVGASCNVVIKYAPVSGGSTSSLFTVKSDDLAPGKATQTVTVSGTGITTPVLSSSPTSLTFIDVLVGTSEPKSIVVTNTGTADLVITQYTNPTVADFSVISNTCLGTFSPKAGGTCPVGKVCECMVTVAFAPTAAGFKQSSFGLISNDPAFPTTTIPLSGSVKVSPLINATPTEAAFGSVLAGAVSTISITVSNKGTSDLVIAKIAQPAAPFGITADTCSNAILAPLTQTCILTLTYTPGAIAGITSSATIEIPSNDPAGGGKLPINLSGTSAAAPTISVAPATLSWGSQVVGAPATEKTVTVSNSTPDSTLGITSIGYPSSPFKVVSDSCTGATLLFGDSCAINIAFIPASYATYSPYYLTINSNAPSAPVTKVTLSGTGIKKPTIYVSPTSLAFGNRKVNTTSVKKTITVKNTATNSNLIIGTVAIPAPFLKGTRNTCNGASLTYGKTCVIDVVFKPTAKTTYSKSLTIPSNDTSKPVATVALTGKGI